MIKKGKGKQIRTRGNRYETQLARELRKIGWEKCVTSRAESRNLDSKGIDLVYTDPFNIQAKCKNNFGTPIKYFKDMPLKTTNYNIVIQKVPHKGEYVTIKKKDFYEILGMLKSNKII